MESQQKKRSSLGNPVVIGCAAIFLVVLVFGALVLGAIIWLFSGPEGGVKLANEMDQYALDYLEANNILEPNEALIAYYDVTISMDGTEAAILSTERVIYHKEGRSTAIRLNEIEDIQHRYESFTGDVIEVTSSSGVIIKIEIAPLNQGETFNNVLLNAWERTQE
jgi:hypothetical protein